MSILSWEKPKKVRTTKEHNDTFVADGAPPGTYVPNMSDEDVHKWKAKKVGGNDPRVEVRVTVNGKPRGSDRWGPSAAVLLVIRPEGTVVFSANGKAEMDIEKLTQAIAEAKQALEE